MSKQKGFMVTNRGLSPRVRLVLLGLAVAILVPSSGCMLLDLSGKSAMDELVSNGTDSSYTVMIKGDKPATKEISEGMTLQKVLQECGAIKRFGRMDVVVQRVIPGKQMRHRLSVDFDPKKRRIPFEQDYTVHPNDIVTIVPDNSTHLDRMVDSITGVLNVKR